MQRNDRSKLLTFIVYVFSILNEPEGKALVYNTFRIVTTTTTHRKRVRGNDVIK